MTRTQLLRTLGVIAVAAGIVDPGCRQTPRGVATLATVGDVSPEARERLLAQVRDAAPWATVVREDEPSPADAEVTARVVAGDPAPVFQALGARRAHVALQSDEPTLALESITVPNRVMSGLRSDVHVTVGGVPASAATVRVVLRDPVSGLEQGRAEKRIDAATGERTAVAVPWLATRVGPARLQVHASVELDTAATENKGTPSQPVASVRPAPPAEVLVDVAAADARVAMLEARPTWSGRFARLALVGAPGLRMTSEVRVAPGIAVRTNQEDRESREAREQAEVLLVSGLEALGASDVARLDRDVRERGRALVLLMDDEPGPGPWRRLWPDATGPVRRAMHPVTGLVAGHPWKMREWLSPAVSTGTAPLAYLDSETAPFVVGRAHGAGRILLVTALDAWRWRSESGAAFDAGWRALVQRLAVDVPPPLAVTAWTTGNGRRRALQVEAVVRRDVEARGPVALSVRMDPDPSAPVSLVRVADGRWRGHLRLGPTAPARAIVTARSGDTVVGEVPAVIDVSPHVPVAVWEDVVRRQAERGAVAAQQAQLAQALDAQHARVRSEESHRWYVTRTWWFAALALALLGTEWILRRRQGER